MKIASIIEIFISAGRIKYTQACICMCVLSMTAMSAVAGEIVPNVSDEKNAQGVGGEYVWLEAENPTSANVTGNTNEDARPEWLSGGKWIKYTGAAVTIPADGIRLGYSFTTKTNATFGIWARIGFEFVRSSFDWRVDNDDWSTITPDALTTDLMALTSWREVAWLQLGKRRLAGGTHTLEIRVLAPAKDEHGNARNLLFGCDAFCIDSDTFAPNGKWQPGEDWRNDEERIAGKKIYAWENPKLSRANPRCVLALNGVWEVTRDDEQLPESDIATPIQALPRNPRYFAITVPGDKNTVRPELAYCHRLWYRARIDIPRSFAGKTLFLTFPANNLNTTVYLNGKYCGFSSVMMAPFEVDVSRAVKPGSVNELMVGIRDVYYAYYNDPMNPMVLRRRFNQPRNWPVMQMTDLSASSVASGMLETPTLTATSARHATDTLTQQTLVPVSVFTAQDIPEAAPGKPAWLPGVDGIAYYDKWVYVASKAEYVLQFERDPATAKLTYQGATPFIWAHPDPMNTESSCQIRLLDDSHAMLTVSHGADLGGLMWYAIDTHTGKLTPAGKQAPIIYKRSHAGIHWTPDMRRFLVGGDTYGAIDWYRFNDAGAPVADGSYALKNASVGNRDGMAMLSPDMRQLYYLVFQCPDKDPNNDKTPQIDTYDIDPTTHAITYRSTLALPIDGSPANRVGGTLVPFSPDGRHLYVFFTPAYSETGTYYVLARDVASGALTIASRQIAPPGLSGLSNPDWERWGRFEFAGDGRSGYCVADIDSTHGGPLGRFTRNPDTGALTFFAPVAGMGARVLTVDAVNGNLFTVGGKIASFKIAGVEKERTTR